jgi:hypothetical protein
MSTNLRKRLEALEAKLRLDTIRCHLASGRVITLGGKDPAMRLLRAAVGNGSAEDEAILRDAVSFEEGDGYIAELAKAIYDSKEHE